LIGSPLVDFVAFTGSVAGGHAVQEAAALRFIGVGLELGGKDPAYVRADANSRMQWRILWTALTSIPANPAAALSASTHMQGFTTNSSMVSSS